MAVSKSDRIPPDSAKTRYFTRSSKNTAITSNVVRPATPVPGRRFGTTADPSNLPITPIRTRQSDDMEDTVDLLTGLKIDAYETPGSALSAFSYAGAAEMAKLEAPTEDEQVVNTALILFLTAITIHFTTKVHWSLVRKAFKISKDDSKQFEARVDGVLSHASRTLAILEVKPFLRLSAISRIRAQETAQMACWISSEPDPPTSASSIGPDGAQKRMLISQDKSEVWLTLAEFDESYVEYIRRGTIPHGDKGFLRMQEFGPLEVNNQKHMRRLGHYILAFVLEQSEGIP